MADELLVTIDEAARRLSLSRAYLYGHLTSGALPSVYLGRARRIRVADLEVFADSLVNHSVDD